ncbi:MAG: AMP-dependent synthetase/ligase [Fidelibacterota bacterium]
MIQRPIHSSSIPLPDYAQNLAVLLKNNAEQFSDNPIYQEVNNQSYVPLKWNLFYQRLRSIQSWLLDHGFQPGDRMAILSRNCQKMLELELAVMSMGAVSVPIFSGYPPRQANQLLQFCNPTMVAVDDLNQLQKIESPDQFSHIITFSSVEKNTLSNLFHVDTLTSAHPLTEIVGSTVPPETVSLMMYTSGTMGIPKCVQLTHQNILSQQAAMKALWDLNSQDRFLSYLPWHHSFGGIFEKYAAIVNGALLSLEHGYGKNIDILLENWDKVRPTVFFSVPRIYQAIATRIIQDKEIEKMIFHPELRFIFTAAAPLPKNIADLFDDHGIPVVEGWGLTETSPCCTVTDPTIPREPGVVGKPIPGVFVKIDENGEILVQGPNVMTGYYRNPEATKKVMKEDGWFCTGDVGEYTESGLKLVSRKDRIFKLVNGEKVVPTEIENIIAKDCAYLAHAFVTGNGRDYPVVLLFPNKNLFSQKPDESLLLTNCQCPSGMEDYVQCLTKCLNKWNQSIDAKFSRYKKAMLIDYELSIENEELTPSMKLSPNRVGNIFKARIESLYENEDIDSEEVYVINLE